MITPAASPLPPTGWVTWPRPRYGWITATTARRTLAAATAPLLILTVALAALDNIAAQLLALVAQLSLGSVCCYATARILRPTSMPTSTERTLRHGCAALVTAAVSYVAAAVVLTRGTDWFGMNGGFLALWWLLPLAPWLVLLTMVWGLLAVLVRLHNRSN